MKHKIRIRIRNRKLEKFVQVAKRKKNMKESKIETNSNSI